MKKQPNAHSYLEQAALDRLLLLIAIFIHHPGIGCPNEDDSHTPERHHNALSIVANQLQNLAIEYGYGDIANSVPTLRKDLEFLRKYGILEKRMYRWGYYLGTGIFSPQELPVAVQALRDIGKQLGDPIVRDLYRKLEKRMRGLELSDKDLYPVRSQLNRSITHTDPEQMREQQNYRQTLFDKLPELEIAIITGQGIEVYYTKSPYPALSSKYWEIYPLQLLYHDVGWYLICEEIESGYLAAIRLDRLSSHFRLLTHSLPRGKSAQLDRLKVVNHLFKNGWGINLGSKEQQFRELQGEGMISVKVRFFEQVAPFIQEGEKRHPRQQIKLGKKNTNGKLAFIDYSVVLPERSTAEFFRWVRRFGSQALVLAPEQYVQSFRQELQLLLERYQE